MIKRFRYDFKSGIVADGKGDFISYAEYEALQQKLVVLTEQRDALVVENAVLIDLARKFAEKADDYKSALMGFNVSESFDQLKGAGTKEYTDAEIASLRAEEVEMFGVWLRNSADIFDKNERPDWADQDRVAADKAKEFARQLRESKGESKL